MTKPVSLLIILRTHERIRAQYFKGISEAFPDVKVNAVKNVAEADPYLADADIIVTHGPHLELRADYIFANAPNLKWVQGTGTGVDNIADRPTLKKDVIVTKIHGVHGAPMSEAAISAMLALSRDLPRSFENQTNRKWENWPSRLLYGKTVGIFGLGSIAESMAPRLKAMGMQVVGLTSTVREVAGFDRISRTDEILNAVSSFDFFILLTPYTPQTHHIINEAVFERMKSSSYLINLARGGVVHEEALLKALKSKTIAGAFLDVFSQEPLQANSPFWDLDNAIITCHQAATHDESAKNNVPIINHNIACFLKSDFASMKNVVARTSLA